MRRLVSLALLAVAATASAQTMAAKPADNPHPFTSFPYKDELTTLPNFHFGTGESLPELKLHYLTLGTPHRNAQGHVDNAVLVLHGTGGNRFTLTVPQFANELFAPGQPLDAAKYFLIFPDDIGQGDSSRPSDGLHMRFPQYDYDDMVRSQHAMLEALHIDHLRLIIGTSMGCMQSFVWGETYPNFADALMPLACLPTQIAGRNRMMRYMAIENIKNDPAWKGGEYTAEPTVGLRAANEMLLVMSSSPLVFQKAAPTRDAAEKFVDNYLARTTAATDANNLIYYVNSSRNYNPEPNLEKITVPVMFINSADDYINPPELGIAERLTPRMPHARFILLPITPATRGHGTHTQAALWKQYLVDLLARSEHAPTVTSHLSVEPAEMHPNGTVWASLLVENDGDVEIPMPEWTVHVRGVNGEPPTTLRQRQRTHRLLPGEQELMPTGFRPFIGPKATFTQRTELNKLYDLSRPGEYTVSADFDIFTGGEARVTEHLNSNTTSFVVIP